MPVKLLPLNQMPTGPLSSTTTVGDVVVGDRGNDYAKPPLLSAGLSIEDVDNDGLNELVIRQGSVSLTPKWDKPFQMLAIGTHHAGGPGDLTVTGYNRAGNPVDQAQSMAPNQGVYEKLWLLSADISYVEIRGQEVWIDEVGFVMN